MRADIALTYRDVRLWHRQNRVALHMSAFCSKADMRQCAANVRFRGQSGDMASAVGSSLAYFRDFTNGRGGDVDGPIPHAKPDRRMHIREVPHTRAVPHRADIHQPPLAAALQ